MLHPLSIKTLINFKSLMIAIIFYKSMNTDYQYWKSLILKSDFFIAEIS